MICALKREGHKRESWQAVTREPVVTGRLTQQTATRQGFRGAPRLIYPVSDIASLSHMQETRARQLPNFIIAGAPKSGTTAQLTRSAAKWLANTEPINPVARAELYTA